MDGTAPSGFIRSRGMKIPRNPALMTRRLKHALRTDGYERKECDAVLRVVQDGDRVLELGAGMGYMSTLIATQKKVESIDSYEANPRLIDYIREVHAANGVTHARVHNALLAAEPGPPVPFHIRQNFLASSLDAGSDPDTIVDTVQIEQRGLREVLANLRPTILVCDIEGAEATLLPAADWTGLRAAVIELHPQWIGQAGVQAVFDAMQRAGLTYFPKASEAKVVCFRRW